MAKKKPKAESDVQEILATQVLDESEEEKIRELFRGSRLKRIQALFDELAFGKGIARLQAEARLEILEREMAESAESVIELDWDVVASSDAKGKS